MSHRRRRHPVLAGFFSNLLGIPSGMDVAPATSPRGPIEIVGVISHLVVSPCLATVSMLEETPDEECADRTDDARPDP
jgi:hypothetical protein